MVGDKYENPWGNKDKPRNFGANPSRNSNIYDMEQILESFKGKFSSNGGGGFRFSWPVIWLVALLLFGLWMASGFYTVNPEEQGVELTFGRHTDTTEPGLRYHLPYPIGEVTKLKVASVNRNEVGVLGNRRSEGEGIMLTGDENIVNVNFEVQWRIKNAYDFLYHVNDGAFGISVKNAAESAMRDAIGQNKIAFILRGEGRGKIADETHKVLQKILDEYKMGVQILSIQMKKVDPPEKVINAFRDVQSARADKERLINQAYSYKNDALPRARGDAQVILEEAQAYKIEAVNRAQGDTKRFLEIYKQYKSQPYITKKRMTLEMLEKVYKDTDKIILDKENGGLLKFFDIARK